VDLMQTQARDRPCEMGAGDIGRARRAEALRRQRDPARELQRKRIRPARHRAIRTKWEPAVNTSAAAALARAGPSEARADPDPDRPRRVGDDIGPLEALAALLAAGQLRTFVERILDEL